MDGALYNAEILRLAASIPFGERLPRPHGTAERRSPVCGSRVTADACIDAAGRITAFGQQVRACALGQASAAILAGNIIGRTATELETAATLLRDWLKGSGPLPSALATHWPKLILFEPARAHPARHPSIALAFEAAAEAALALEDVPPAA